MSDETVLSVDGLTKEFGGLTAVDDVSFGINPNETKALIGPNGAGKTTLINCINGSYDATAGSIQLNNEDITNISAHNRVRKGLGRTYQVTNVFEDSTVFENVRLAAQAAYGQNFNPLIHYSTVTESTTKAAEVLERVDLIERGEILAGQLSHGERRQLEIAMALALDPEVLLLDEPAAGMGSDELPRVRDLIESIGDEYAILLVEHNMELVMDLADSIIVLDRGSKIADGPPETVRHDDDVLDAYLGTSVDFTETANSSD